MCCRCHHGIWTNDKRRYEYIFVLKENRKKCDRSHEIGEDVELKCGKSFSFPPVCVEDHKWICPNCSKNIPSGNTLQRTPAGHDHDHTTCKTLLSYEINDPMKFKYCTHNAIKKITTTCGSSITGNNCSNKEHIILCKNCFEDLQFTD